MGYPGGWLKILIKKKVNEFKFKKMSRITFDTLLEAGAHFGHLKSKWNPAMAPYIFMERNGIHIIDLHKTAAMTETAAEALKQIAKSGKKILFVSALCIAVISLAAANTIRIDQEKANQPETPPTTDVSPSVDEK